MGQLQRQTVRTAIAVLAVALIVAACGTDSSSDTESTVVVTNARVRAVPPGMEVTAAYLDVANNGDADDELLAASVPADIAGGVELHETVVMEDSGDIGATEDMAGETETAMDGMAAMAMQPVESITVRAGETVSLEPGGLHMMLLDLAGPLEGGDEVEVTLEFAESGSVTVSAPVVDSP